MRGIYKITNTNNGKVYIGKSENLAERLKYHIKSLQKGNNKNVHMQNAYDLYSVGSFTVEILEELSDTDNINERERYWIDYYSSNNREYGYNKTDGGDGGNSYAKYLSEENLVRIKTEHSKRMKGSGNPNYKKHCFTDGVNITYISDDEICDYLNNGWVPGVPMSTKEKEKSENRGVKNGFYEKHHSDKTKETLSKQRKGEKNWNYGKTIIHKDNIQKYIDSHELNQYLSDGWTIGVSDYVKEKLSESNTGKKRKDINPSAKIYNFDGNDFYGWRKLKTYLNENGYPKISETAILKLANGLSVRGYDDLFQKIKVRTQ